MKHILPEELRRGWQQLTPLQRFCLLRLVLSYSIPNRLRRLRPTDVVAPAVLAQVIVFVAAILSPTKTILILATGNFVIVALAMLPSLMHPKPKIHVSHT